MTEAILILILFLHFCIQIYPRIYKSEVGIDLYRWLLYSRIIRSAKFRLPKYIDKYIIKERFSYPPVFLIFLSLFSTKFLNKHNYIISPFFSIIENIFLFYVSYLITGNETTALTASLIYAVTPANIIENIHLGTRSIGQFTFFIYVTSLYFYVFQDYSILYVTFASALVFITHRMSTQLLFFTSLFSSVILGDILIFFSIFLSMFISMIITFGHYSFVLRGHIQQVYFYIKALKQNTKNLITFNKNFIFAIFGRNLFILFALYLAITSPNSEIEIAISYLYIFIFCIAVLTTFVTILRSIGEGHRYIAFLNPLCSFFIACKIDETNYFMLFIFIALSIIPVLYKFRQLKNNQSKENHSFLTPSFESFISNYFKKNADVEKIRFMSFPPNLDDFVAYKYPNSYVMFHDNGFALEESYIVPFHKSPEEKVKKFLSQHDIDLFVSLKKFNLQDYQYKIIDNIHIYERVI